MDLHFTYSELFLEYKTLLTKHQAEIFDFYYNCDLSLAEISELKNVSRQAVSDSLCKTRELLESYERSLRLLEKKRALIKLSSNFENSEYKDALLKMIGEL
ncbi:MAG: DNA-binding protein [Clostridia bacterium]|nr:DNA-binding protein [Clostridia bacterium]